jgi:RNA polymerase sigma-70 factor (ECF subfamily)
MDKAFDILGEQYRPMVVAYLRSLVNDAELAEDLAQETILAAYQSFDKFERGANFGAWLRGIARNKALHNRRTESRRIIIADSEIIAGMESVYSAFDNPSPDSPTWLHRLERIRNCVQKLSEKLREAMVQVYENNQTIEAAAQSLQTSADALAQRLSRARSLVARCVSLPESRS